jgi:hypothetical protein
MSVVHMCICTVFDFMFPDVAPYALGLGLGLHRAAIFVQISGLYASRHEVSV